VALDAGVLRFTLDRPATRNALTGEVMDAMLACLVDAGQDDTVRAIVLGSSGADFCSGADIIARNADDGERPRVGSVQRRMAVQSSRLVSLLLNIQTPVVTAVRGWAAGIGFHLALASDFCVASTTARFWEPFVTRGFTPDSGGTWLLPRLAGAVRARQLLVLGRELSGGEAVEWGLIHHAVDDADLDAEVGTLVDRLAGGPTVAIGLTKWLLHTGGGLDFDRHLQNEAFAMELSSRSPDFREGLTAFRQHRDAAFTGR
jgi:2-(1,2-epoxy-1,2-dihydrophenyl)acetyl-CoA isomerase